MPDIDTPAGSFAERLYFFRRKAGLSQSDLARKVWGTTTDSRGYEVARNRDRVSAYELGKAMPTRGNLDELAKALGVTSEELGPELVSGRRLSLAQTADNLPRGVHVLTFDSEPGQGHLQLNLVLSLTDIAKVLADLEPVLKAQAKAAGRGSDDDEDGDDAA